MNKTLIKKETRHQQSYRMRIRRYFMEILMVIAAIVIVIAVIKSMFKLAIFAGAMFLIYYLVTTVM